MTETSTTTETRSGVLAAALVSLTEHIVTYKLPFPRDIYVTTDDDGREGLRILVSGAGQQMRWLNKVTIDGEAQEPSGPGRIRMAWQVRLPDGTRFELVGHRQGDLVTLAEVPA